MRINWQARGNSFQTVNIHSGFSGFVQQQSDGKWTAAVGGCAHFCVGLPSKLAAVRWANRVIREAVNGN